jgi:hypothetical protein
VLLHVCVCVQVFLEYVSVNGIIRGINLGVTAFDELIDCFMTKTFRGKLVKMEPTDIIRLNIKHPHAPRRQHGCECVCLPGGV